MSEDVESEIDVDTALEYCQKLLQGPWREVTFKDFTLEIVSGGLSNYLCSCSLPEDWEVEDGTPKKVILRKYGKILKDNAEKVVLDSVVFALLSEKKLGPKLYGVFEGGRLEEYIPSRSLETYELRLPHVSAMIAQLMSQFHKLDMPVCKEPMWVVDQTTKWLHQAQNNIFSHGPMLEEERDKLEKLKSFKLEVELEYLKNLLASLKSPVVFCHNDLQEGNILSLTTDETTPVTKIMAIDFEYCSYNYRSYDIANTFCEWCYDYKSCDEPPYYIARLEDYPNREQQLEFLKIYLAHSEPNPSDCDLQQAAENMLYDVNACALASHFLWGMWSLVSIQHNNIKFGYLDYALTRFEHYFIQKETLDKWKV